MFAVAFFRKVRMGQWLAFAMVICLLGGGCAGQAKKTQKAEKPKISQEQFDQMVKQKIASDPFLRSQVDVGLEARWVEPGKVQVNIKNKMAKPLEIDPVVCLGMFVPPNRTINKALPSSRSSFPSTRLEPNAEASGIVLFPPQAAGAKCRLAFEHPDCRPAMAEIE